jgi:predicted PurR-regulated permease PerM
MIMMNKYPPSIKITYVLLSVILFFYAIIAAKEFLYPIVLGVLFGYLLYPIACFFEKNGFPRILANIFSILIFLIVVGSALLFIYKQAGSFIDDFPIYKQKALSNIDHLESELENQFGLSDLRLVDLIRLRVKLLFEAGSNVFNNAFQSTAGTLFRIAVLPVYIFLFLFYRTKLALFILKIVPKEKKIIAIHVLKDYSHVVSRYMGGMSTVVMILAILNSTGLLIVGIDHAIVFGIISALFNFIPYFGTLMGGSIPFIFALLTGESPLLALHVLILFIIIQFIENNILTPNIVGSNLRLNPMVIIIGIIAGGMVWGIPGMFAVVPILAMLNILAENVVGLHPYAFLLGITGARKHAITLENIRNFFNKLKNRSRRS